MGLAIFNPSTFQNLAIASSPSLIARQLFYLLEGQTTNLTDVEFKDVGSNNWDTDHERASLLAEVGPVAVDQGTLQFGRSDLAGVVLIHSPEPRRDRGVNLGLPVGWSSVAARGTSVATGGWGRAWVASRRRSGPRIAALLRWGTSWVASLRRRSAAGVS